MNNTRRKMLTEKVLGECWHELNNHKAANLCDKCGNHIPAWESTNRTFVNDTDMMALFRKLMDNGEWAKFSRFAYSEWYDEMTFKPTENNYSAFARYLFYDPARFCELVGEWEEKCHS